ncbi:hypothetical protein V5799_017877, partial [Amblyomma americanum]
MTSTAPTTTTSTTLMSTTSTTSTSTTTTSTTTVTTTAIPRETLYLFLRNHRSSYLFTLDFGGTLEQVKFTIDQPQFATGVQMIIRHLYLRGFGLLPTVPGVATYRTYGDFRDIQKLHEIYQ